LTSALRLAVNLRGQVRYEESEDLFQQTIATARAQHGDAHKVTLDAVRQYAYLLHKWARHTEEERNIRRALEAARKELPEGDLLIAKLAKALGESLRSQKRWADAAEAFQEAHEGFHHDSPGVTLPALNNTANYARTLHEIGQPAEAEALLLRKLDDCRREHGENHQFTLWMRFELGDELGRQKRFDEAEPILRHAVDHYSQVLSDDHAYVVFAKEALARVLRDMDKLDDARQVAREAYEARNLLGHILKLMRRYEEAEEIYREQLEVQTRVHGIGGIVTLGAMNALGEVLTLAEKLDEAEPLLRESLAALREVSGEDDYWTQIFRMRLAQLLVKKGDHAEAEPLFLALYRGMRDIQGPYHRETLWALKMLAEFYDAWGKPEKAAEYRALLQEAQDAIDSD
jgi:tetratricopeptide (TPR) repeat protein